MTASPTGVTYARRLGLFSATMMVMGGIIGSGIFLNPAIVAQRVGTASLTLAAWATGAVIAGLGALVYAELGARRPEAGGNYVYIRDALGGLPGFLFAWTWVFVVNAGAIAAVAVTFTHYLVAALGTSAGAGAPVAIGAIVLLTIISCVGLGPSAVTLNLLTILKLGALALLIVAGMAWAGGAADPAPARTTGVGASAFAAALGPVLFAVGGWDAVNRVAAEVRDPGRNLPRSLVLGAAGVGAVYLLANVAYLQVLGPAGLAASTAPAADLMRRVAGEGGARLVSAGIACSTFGFLGVAIFSGSRVAQAMAADQPALGRIARLHPRWRTPVPALVAQAAWAIALLLMGTYGELLDWVVFGDWIFFGLAGVSLFVLRHREPATGSFRVPGFPVVPALFVLAAAYAVYGMVASNPGNALRGAAFILAGIPLYFFIARRRGA
ncbi:MAG TPA: amino acid permease [Gemmatimonadales bacterium]|nr:amino acid permease [Gemmatimonadales bacterium]